jgi:hypothetical protein
VRDNGTVTDAPNRPEPTEPVDPATTAEPAGAVEPAASVDPGPPHPKVEHLGIDPDAPGEHLETEVTSDAVTMRRAPRYGRFLTLGGALGAVVALALTMAFPENPDYDKGQVFGFLLLACGAVGVALGALIALLIDRAFARRAGSAVAEHESTHYVEGDSES